MTSAQALAHERLYLMALQSGKVTEHIRNFADAQKRKNMVRPSVVSSAAGRKGRIRAGLVVPAFRTLGQRQFNHKG